MIHIFPIQILEAHHQFQTIVQSEISSYFLINHKLTRVYILYRHAKTLRHVSPLIWFTLKEFETTSREIGLIIFRTHILLSLASHYH